MKNYCENIYCDTMYYEILESVVSCNINHEIIHVFV